MLHDTFSYKNMIDGQGNIIATKSNRTGARQNFQKGGGGMSLTI